MPGNFGFASSEPENETLTLMKMLIICYVPVMWLIGHQKPHGNVKSERVNKCWKPGTFSFLANELISVPKVVQ